MAQRPVLWGEHKGNILPAYLLKATPPFYFFSTDNDSNRQVDLRLPACPGAQRFPATLGVQLAFHSCHTSKLDTSADSNPLSLRFPTKPGTIPIALPSSPSAPYIERELRTWTTHLTLTKRLRNRETRRGSTITLPKGMSTEENSCVCFRNNIAGLRRKPRAALQSLPSSLGVSAFWRLSPWLCFLSLTGLPDPSQLQNSLQPHLPACSELFPMEPLTSS